jgi:LPXTG-motif cell wall-anchored protein
MGGYHRRMGRIPTRALALACALGAGLAAPGVLWAADTSPTSTAATSTTSTTSTTTTTTAAAESPPQDAAATTTTEAPPPPPATTTAAAPPPPPQPASAPQPARSKPIARAAASGGVTIQDFAFHPGSVTVSVGDTVTWTNHDSTDHTATASDGSFDTGTLGRGQSGSHTFTRAGTFSYICSIHPNMHGTVVVVGSSSSSGSGSATSTGSGSGSSSSTTGTSPAATGSSLPNTGLQVGAVALLGLVLLGTGGLLRRALRARDQG